MKNPQAFPRAGSFGIDNEGGAIEVDKVVDGMTLLDYFAAKVMQAMMADSAAVFVAAQKVNTTPPNFIAVSAYSAAEAMLKEREKRIK